MGRPGTDAKPARVSDHATRVATRKSATECDSEFSEYGSTPGCYRTLPARSDG